MFFRLSGSVTDVGEASKKVVAGAAGGGLTGELEDESSGQVSVGAYQDHRSDYAGLGCV